MGALASLGPAEEVRRSLKALEGAGHIVFGDPERVEVTGADPARGAFISPVLLVADDAHRAEVHEVEAFGPVATLIGYRDTADVIDLAGLGLGSLVGSVVTDDQEFARDVVLGTAPWHGRPACARRRRGRRVHRARIALPARWCTAAPAELGRRRGDGRPARCAPPHAAHRRPGQPAHAAGRHRPLGQGRAAADRRHSPVHQVPGDAAHRRHHHRRPAHRDA